MSAQELTLNCDGCANCKKLMHQVEQLELAEEGAAEAFGVVVQQKRDLETEVNRLRKLLADAYDIINRRK